MTPLKTAAKILNTGAKSLQDTARQIRALDALSSSMSDAERERALSKVVGELRAFRATTLEAVIQAVDAQTPAVEGGD